MAVKISRRRKNDDEKIERKKLIKGRNIFFAFSYRISLMDLSTTLVFFLGCFIFLALSNIKEKLTSKRSRRRKPTEHDCKTLFPAPLKKSLNFRPLRFRRIRRGKAQIPSNIPCRRSRVFIHSYVVVHKQECALSRPSLAHHSFSVQSGRKTLSISFPCLSCPLIDRETDRESV